MQPRPPTITAAQHPRQNARASASVERAKPLYAHRSFAPNDSTSSSETDTPVRLEPKRQGGGGGRAVVSQGVNGSPEIDPSLRKGREEGAADKDGTPGPDLSFVSGDVSGGWRGGGVVEDVSEK